MLEKSVKITKQLFPNYQQGSLTGHFDQILRREQNHEHLQEEVSYSKASECECCSCSHPQGGVMFHLVMGNCNFNQSNNQNRLGQQSEATQSRRKSTDAGSEDPSALPGIRTTLSVLMSLIYKNKGTGPSLPNSKIHCLYIQDDVYILTRRPH